MAQVPQLKGFAFTSKVTGITEAEKIIKNLKGSVQNKILRKAVTKASTIVKNAVQIRVPKFRGLMRKSIGRKTFTNKRRVGAYAIVGTRTGFDAVVHGKKLDPVRYGHFPEYGTQFQEEQMPVRRGAEETRPQVAAIIADEVRNGLEAECIK
jgi:HK97 gp10 family phage protein